MHQLRACLVLASLIAAFTSFDVLTSENDSGTLSVPGVDVLAKAGNWREGLMHSGAPFAILEIAPDRATAEVAWRENVPDTLSAGTEDGYGLYGGLKGVDFNRQAVVVWSSGESGSCPDWIVDLRTTEGGTIEVEIEDGRWLPESPDPNVAYICTDDYRYYRMVLAVDRDRLPDLASLPSEDIVGVPDGIVTVYPYEPPGVGY